MMLVHDTVRELQHLCGGGRIEGGGMLVQQEKLRLAQRGHQQGDRLALAAGEQADLGQQPVLQPEAKHLQPLTVLFGLFFGHLPAQAALLPAPAGQGEVFHQLHVRRGAHHGILKNAADQPGALVLGKGSDVIAVQENAPLVHRPDAGDGVEHGRLAGTVAADDGDKVAGVQMQGQLVQGKLFIDGAGVEGLADLTDVKHFSRPPSS